MWEPTGIPVRVQEDAINLVLHPGRGRDSGYGMVMEGSRITTVPNDWLSMAFSQKVDASNQVKVTFAFTSSDGNCAALNGADATETLEMGPVKAGEIVSRSQFSSALLARGLGIQNVCMRVGRAEYWSSGLSLKIQDEVSSMVVNGVRPNRGLLVPIPVVDSSKLTYTGRRAPRPSLNGMNGTAGDLLSFIGPGRKCADHKQNPPTFVFDRFEGSASGYIDFVAQDLLSRQVDVVLNPILMQTVLKYMPQQRIFKVCFRAEGVGPDIHETGFINTGLAIVLQEELVSIQVNAINDKNIACAGKIDNIKVACAGNNRGVRTTIPLALGNIVQLTRNGTMSLIKADRDCSDTSAEGENMPINNLSAQKQSLHIVTQKPYNTLTTKLLDGVTGVGGAKSPGLYQVCFKADIDGSEFRATGLAVTIQDTFTSLFVNEAAPNGGLRVAVPKSDGNRMRYTNSIEQPKGHILDTIALISIGGDCMSPEDNPKNRTSAGSWNGVSIAQSDSSGHILSGAGDMSFLNLKLLALMSPGLYAVCFKSGTQSTFILTGIAFEIQSYISALLVNNVAAAMANVPKTVGNLFWIPSERALHQ